MQQNASSSARSAAEQAAATAKDFAARAQAFAARKTQAWQASAQARMAAAATAAAAAEAAAPSDAQAPATAPATWHRASAPAHPDPARAPSPAHVTHQNATSEALRKVAERNELLNFYRTAMSADDPSRLSAKVLLGALRFRGVAVPPGSEIAEVRALFVAKKRNFDKDDRAKAVAEVHRQTVAKREEDAEHDRNWREQYSSWLVSYAKTNGDANVLRLLAGDTGKPLPMLSEMGATSALMISAFGVASINPLVDDEARTLHRKALLRMHPDKHTRGTAEEKARAAEATAWLTANKSSLLGGM